MKVSLNTGTNPEESSSTISNSSDVSVLLNNTAPTASNKTITFNEDNSYTFSAADFGYADAEGDSMASVKITSLPTVGSLKLGSTAVTINQVISAAAIPTLNFTPAANAYGNNYASFNFTVNDGLLDSASGNATYEQYASSVIGYSSEYSPSAWSASQVLGASNTFSYNDLSTAWTASSANTNNPAGQFITVGFTTPVYATGAVVRETYGNGFVTQIDAVDTSNVYHTVWTGVDNSSQGTPVDFLVSWTATAYLTKGLKVYVNTAKTNGFEEIDSVKLLSASVSNAINFNVTAVNDDPPTASSVTLGMSEDATYFFWSGIFGYNDVDGDSMASLKIISLPAAGSLKLSGTAVSLNQVIPTALLTNLTFAPAANANGTNYASFNFKVNDGSLDSVLSYSFKFNVTAVNDKPTLTNFAAPIANGNENTEIPITFVNLQAQGNDADIDGTVTAFVVKAVSSGSLKIGASAATATVWNAATNNTIDATKNAYWTPATNANGALNAFTVVAKDNGNLESITPIQTTVNVITSNIAPTLTSFTDSVAFGNKDTEIKATFTELLNKGDEADSDGTVTAFVVKAVSTGSLKIGTSAATATAWNATTNNTIDATNNAYWTPATNANGTLNAFTVVAKDDGGLESTTAVQAQVRVMSSNTPPTAADKTITFDEDSSYTFAVTDFGYSDVENSPLASLKITSLPALGSLKLSDVEVSLNQIIPAASIANLTFTPATNANGTNYASFSFTVNDGSVDSVTANNIVFDVTAVNDAPTLTGFITKVGSGNEDNEILINVDNLQQYGDAADIDGTVTAFIVKEMTAGSLKIGTSAESATVWNATTNNVINTTLNGYWTPAPNANGVLNAFKVVAQDNEGLESNTLIQATVRAEAVNDLPVGAVTIIGTAQQGQTLTAQHNLTDSDGLGVLSYTWQSSDDGVLWIDLIDSDSLSLTAAHLDKQIRVLAHYIDDGNTAESVASVATSKVSVAMTLLTIDDDNYTDSHIASVVNGLTGNDLIYGNGGDDSLSGGSDDDSLYGGAGHDSLIGDADDDLLYGSSGNDVLYAGSIAGLAADDGINKLYGGSGNDTLTSGADNDVLSGGSGKDTASYALASSAVQVSLAHTGRQNTGFAGDDNLIDIENLIGGAGADSLAGNNKANSLTGGLGNDSLNGGAGSDTAVFAGNAADYSFSRDDAGHLIVTDTIENRDGNDALNPDLEIVQFADQSLLAGALGLTATRSNHITDFNGNGKSDLLLTHNDGSVRAVTLNGLTSSTDAVIYNATATGNGAWQIINSKGDYDADGKTDLLLWNSSTSAAKIALMNGAAISAESTLTDIANPSGWICADSTADYNADGKSDMLWWNASSHSVNLYLHNGGSVLAAAQLFADTGAGWAIQSAGGDYNGDAKGDIFFWNQSLHVAYLATMDGVSISSSGYLTPGASWSPIDVKGDYNGDGNSDILWRNDTTGELWEYQMNGTSILSNASLGTVPLNWTVVDAHSDFNADGKADLLWRNAENTVTTWLMDGFNQSGGNSYYGPYTGWTVQNADNDVNGDGNADVLLTHPDGAVYVMEMNGVNVIGSGTIDTYSGWSVLV